MNVRNITLAKVVMYTKNNKIYIPPSFKAYGIGIRILSSFLFFIPFVVYGAYCKLWHIILLLFLVFSVLLLTVKLLTIKSFEPTI